MNNLADYKRTRTTNKKKYVKDFVEGILDVIETDYPHKYFMMFEDQTQIPSLFTNEEWIDILTKSRNSYSNHAQRLNLTKKYPVQENRAEIGRLIMMNSPLERSKSE
jgi:hypothetical protein